ncbi:Hypothetical protein A7982_11921 [Minicystis rosea]|nr:Hypothetical protein A7982_11921 [Minicystis rosea]
MNLRGAISILLAALPVIAAALPARADAPPPARSSEASSRRVTVVLLGEPRARTAVEEVLRELFGRLPVDLEIQQAPTLDLQAVLTPPASAPPRLARIWIDARAPERATVYLVDGPWERILVRHVPLHGGLDEVAREEVGHIAETSVGALLGGGTIGVTRAEARVDLGLPATPPPATPRPAPPRSKPPRPAALAPLPSPVHLFAGYGVEAWSSASPIRHGPTLGVALHFPVDAQPGRWSGIAQLLASYRLPNIVDDQAAGVRLDHAVVRLVAGPGYRLSERWSLRALAGGGFDVAHVAPRAGTDTTLALQPATYRVSVLATALLGVAFRASRALHVTALLGVDADALDTRYVVQLGATALPVLVPWRARGLLTVGVDWVL